MVLMLQVYPNLPEKYFASSFRSGLKEELKRLGYVVQKECSLQLVYEEALNHERTLEILLKRFNEQRSGDVKWEDFVKSLWDEVGNHGGFDIVAEFNKCAQVGSVSEYRDKFQVLRLFMLQHYANLPEKFFIYSFISGLKEELKYLVMALNPTSLDWVYDMALIQGESLELVFKAVSMTASGCEGQLSHLIHSKYPNQKSTQEGSSNQNAQRSAGEGPMYKMSIRTLSGNEVPNTWMFIGEHQGRELVIAVVTGSSNSFLDTKAASLLQSHQVSAPPLKMESPTGKIVVSTAICPHFTWTAQGHEFMEHIRLLNLGISDMILGLDWVSANIPFRTSSRGLEFYCKKKGKKIELRWVKSQDGWRKC